MPPITLYIVEDELLISASLKSQLDGNGYLILGEATRGEICLKDLEMLKSKGCEPDIVLMDIQMPVLDGIAALKEWRRSENSKTHVPVIALTAHAIAGTREKYLDEGFDDYVSKPFNRYDILNKISRLCLNKE